jgi:hypothetical protein
MRGIQCAAASLIYHYCLWDTGSSAFADDDSLNSVIASEAKQSIEQQERKNGLLRRFAPRNDGKIRVRDLAACFARGLPKTSRPLHAEGAGNAGRPMRPQPRVQ